MSELIVCATDYSDEAEAALAWAGAFGRRGGGRVDLVHVVRPYNEDSRTMVFEAVFVDAANVEATRAHLREIAEAASREFGIEVRPHVLRGEAHEEVLAHARREGAHLIVLGTTSLVSIERWVIGSVAGRIVRMADRPVVLVRRRQDPSPWRADAPRPPRALVALGETDDVGGVRFATYLRRAGPCDVTFTHVYWPAVEYARLGLTGLRNAMAPDPDVIKSLEPALRRKMETIEGPGQATIDIRPAWGDTTTALLVAAQERQADLLVVGVQRRWGLGRALGSPIGEQLGRVSPDLPIACVPKEHAAAVEGLPNVSTILAATDLSELGNSGIRHAYALLRGRGGVVELCYVHERVFPSRGFANDEPTWRISDAERASLVAQLNALVPREAESLRVTTHVSILDGGRAAETIVRASERLDVDAICLASHGRGGLERTVLGSVASEVVHRAGRPVLVVRRH